MTYEHSSQEDRSKKDLRINRLISLRLTPLLLKTALTPNQITLLSLVCGISSGLFLAQGTYLNCVTGAFFFEIAIVLDNCDGEVARAKNLSSVFGGWLDILADLLTDIFFFLGLTIGVSRLGAEGPFALLGALCVIGSCANALIVSLEKLKGFGPAVYQQPNPKGTHRQQWFFKVIDAVREGDSSWFVIFFLLAGQPLLLLWCASLYIQVLWISALLMNLKWLVRKNPHENY